MAGCPYFPFTGGMLPAAGIPPPVPDVRLQAALEAGPGGNLRSVVQVLEHDPKDKLAAALARLGRAFMACDS